MSLHTGTTLGPYEVVDLIGAGGMGEVYRALDARLGRTVAVKIIRASALADSGATERLVAEARLAASLSHPNIAQIYDIGEREGLPYVVMELVDGPSLEARLAAGPLPIADAIAIGRSLAGALAEAHRRHVIHRDIKPANIVVTPAGHVKVLDFGLAKRLGSGVSGGSLGVSSTGMIMGTAAYMSPEQALGERVTPATDVFSAGVVLYRMIAGALPFSGSNVVKIIDQILHAEPPSLSRPDVPPELRRVIRRALEKAPGDRFADGAALEEALSAVSPGAASVPARASIAVLPFEDLSPDRDNEYFSSGLAEEITVALSSIDSLAVVPRIAASRYREARPDAQVIAADLKVRYLLRGSVRKANADLRITAQLVDTMENVTVWADTFKGTLQNIFEIQEQVARKIVAALTVKLSPRERVTLGKRSTVDAEAFDLYLRGRHHLESGTKRDLDLALSLFEGALARDERYAAAHAGVAATSAAYHEYYDRADRWLDRAVESALRALMYDPTLGDAYAALGHAYFNKGAVDDSRAACRRAIELDPENWVGYWTLGRIHYVTGQTEEAIEVLRHAIALKPDFYPAYFTLRMVCQSVGMDEIYRPYLSRLVEEVFPRYLEKNPLDARARNSYGMELSMAGRLREGREEAERALAAAPDDPLVLYATACYNAVFGDADYALHMLERAIEAGYANLRYMERDPDLRALHDHPRYRALVRGVVPAPSSDEG